MGLGNNNFYKFFLKNFKICLWRFFPRHEYNIKNNSGDVIVSLAKVFVNIVSDVINFPEDSNDSDLGCPANGRYPDTKIFCLNEDGSSNCQQRSDCPDPNDTCDRSLQVCTKADPGCVKVGEQQCFDREDGSSSCSVFMEKHCFDNEDGSRSCSVFECSLDRPDPVYTLNKDGNIECKLDSDCPPAARPSWEWNETTKMKHGVTSITEMAIIVPFCSKQSVVFGDYGTGDYWFEMICEEKREPFCGHEYGRSHPECQRCNVLTPLPEPECIAFELRLEHRRGDVDRCCSDLFNDTLVEELKAQEEDDSQIDLRREEILQNFTMTDCRLSVLHLPQNASPRTSFKWKNICCSYATYVLYARSYCISSESLGAPLSFASAVTGIGSLNQNSLASQNSGSFSCPFGHCKRPSLARPGKIICCLLIQAPWGRRGIAICPYSCD